MQRRVAPLGVLVALALVAVHATARADDDEAQRARAAANKIESTWPLAGSGPVATYVRKLGARLGEKAGGPYPWRFVVVRDRSANAFAIATSRAAGRPSARRQAASQVVTRSVSTSI